MKRRLLTGGGLAAILVVLLASPAFGQEELAPASQFVLDNLFIFIAGVLVFFMQAGFALVEAGLTRSKNVSTAHKQCSSLSTPVCRSSSSRRCGAGFAKAEPNSRS